MSETFQRALITGANGMVGSYVDFGVRTDHATLDITDLEAVHAMCAREKPSLILNLAAATDLARCEREPDYAYRVNTVGAYNLALAAREHGALMVHVSTSGIFDGKKPEPYTETDAPNPLSVFGHSKYLAELAVKGVLSEYLIVRLSWIFGGGPERDKKFVAKILQQIEKPEIKVSASKRGSPTYGKDAVIGIKQLISNGTRGIVHLPNAGAPTRAEVAREILVATQSSAALVEVDEAAFSTPYQSGDNESMTTAAFMRPWQEALREYLRDEWGK